MKRHTSHCTAEEKLSATDTIDDGEHDTRRDQEDHVLDGGRIEVGIAWYIT